MDIYEKLKKAQYFEDPFEHLIIENFFTDEELLKIEQEFPKSKQIFAEIQKQNKIILQRCLEDTKALQYLVKKKNKNDESLLKALKKRAESTYTQNTTYTLQSHELKRSILPAIQEFMTAWQDFSDKAIPFIKSFKSFKNFKANIYNEIAENLKLRSDIRAISPTNQSGTTCLGPHVDASGELVAGLIYLKDKNDSGHGGSLELYKLKETAPSRFMSTKRRIPNKYIERTKVIPYERNIAIVFPNTSKAIHGVSPRDSANFDRRLISFSIELDGKVMMDYSEFYDKSLDQLEKYSLYEYTDSESL
tara:strand:+ start:163 stop:1077 length:915 start_codon:yes stop_codon:yes gene_type:complete